MFKVDVKALEGVCSRTNGLARDELSECQFAGKALPRFIRDEQPSAEIDAGLQGEGLALHRHGQIHLLTCACHLAQWFHRPDRVVAHVDQVIRQLHAFTPDLIHKTQLHAVNARLVVDMNGVPVVGGIVHRTVAVPIPVPHGDVGVSSVVRIGPVERHLHPRTHAVRRGILHIDNRHRHCTRLATIDACCEIACALGTTGEDNGQTPCGVGFRSNLNKALQLVSAALRQDGCKGVVSVVDCDLRLRIEVKHAPLNPNGGVRSGRAQGHHLVFIGAVGSRAAACIHQGIAATFNEVGAGNGNLGVQAGPCSHHKNTCGQSLPLNHDLAHFKRAWALTR